MIKAEWTNADALDLQPTCNQLATDCISRQAAIDALMAWEEGSFWDDECLKHRGEPFWVSPSDVIEKLPSAQPYTDEEIKKIQDIEQAQFDKIRELAYQEGRADAMRWIPCSEMLPEVHETGNSFSGVYMQSYPVLVYGVPEGEEECSFHVVTYCDDLNGYTYWSTELDAVTIDEVKAWMPLPKPYRRGEE